MSRIEVCALPVKLPERLTQANAVPTRARNAISAFAHFGSWSCESQLESIVAKSGSRAATAWGTVCCGMRILIFLRGIPPDYGVHLCRHTPESDQAQVAIHCADRRWRTPLLIIFCHS